MTSTEQRKTLQNQIWKIANNVRCNEYYIVRNWSLKSAEKFSKKIANKFPSITYKLLAD